MEIVKVTTITILLIIMMVCGMKWMEKLDSERQQAYAKYEACFQREFGMLPSTWYSEFGELPECKN